MAALGSYLDCGLWRGDDHQSGDHADFRYSLAVSALTDTQFISLRRFVWGSANQISRASTEFTMYRLYKLWSLWKKQDALMQVQQLCINVATCLLAVRSGLSPGRRSDLQMHSIFLAVSELRVTAAIARTNSRRKTVELGFMDHPLSNKLLVTRKWTAPRFDRTGSVAR
jgi:hypothetical protein